MEAVPRFQKSAKARQHATGLDSIQESPRKPMYETGKVEPKLQ